MFERQISVSQISNGAHEKSHAIKRGFFFLVETQLRFLDKLCFFDNSQGDLGINIDV